MRLLWQSKSFDFSRLLFATTHRSELLFFFHFVTMHFNVLFCFLSIYAKQSVAIVNQDLMAIDLNDILSEKLMPMSIFHMTGSTNSDVMPIDKNREYHLFQANSPADFNSAFNLMQFHRKMIQNYQCNNYIAKQILTDIAPHSIHNRLGIAPNASSKLIPVQS